MLVACFACLLCAVCCLLVVYASRGRRPAEGVPRKAPAEHPPGGPPEGQGGSGGKAPRICGAGDVGVVWCGVVCLFVVCVVCGVCVVCACCLLCVLAVCCVLFACCVCVPDSCQHHTPLGFIICSLVLLCVVCWLFALWLCVGLSSCVVCVVCVAYLGGISTFTIPLVLWLTWRKNYSKAIPA